MRVGQGAGRHTRSIRRALSSTLSVARAVAFAVLAGSGAGALAAPEPIRIALIEGLSGSFANAGAAVERNLQWAVERVNQRGGVRLPGGARPLELVSLDSKGSVEDALLMLRAATGRGIGVVMQGNSSSVAAALIDALERSNERDPSHRVVFLNYSAVDPALTNARCSFWHFRFDAHSDMRLAALVSVLREDRAVRKVYLIGQDYSFGQDVSRQARALLREMRPDIEIVGDELHPNGRVKDFLPYALKIKASGAQAVITGNWGNDLTLLVKAAREAGVTAKFYTFYGNALGAPAAMGEAGVGSVFAVAEWHPNAGGAASDALVADFHARFPDPKDDYLHLRMQVMVDMLAAAMEKAGSADPTAAARALEGMAYDGPLSGIDAATMRAADHQLLQPLYVSVMQKAGRPGVRFDVEGSGYGFETVRRFGSESTTLPQTCRMTRPP